MSDQTPGCGSTTDAAKRLREQSAPVAERGDVETAAIRATQVVYGVLADHPMWIGDDGKPLDYSPARENQIANFLNEIEPLLAEVIGGLIPVTVDGRANTCGHLSATGVDTTSPTDPDKVWRCDHCGVTWRQGAAGERIHVDLTIADKVRKFIAKRAEYMTACRAAGGDDADYYRWVGHAGARRQLAEDLGWDAPGGWM